MATARSLPTSEPRAIAAPDRTANPLAAAAWAVYDIGASIYSVNILSIYFPAFILAAGLADWQYTVPFAISMLIVGVLSPWLGALSDQAQGRRMPWLIGTTLVCCVFVALMGLVGNVLLVIAALIVANAAWQTAGVPYNALLATVSTPRNWGKISGFSGAMGALGTIVGGQSLIWLFGPTPVPEQTFVPTAVLFLLFALPCFFLVRDRVVAGAPDASAGRVTYRASLTATWRTLEEARAYPGLWRFLVSNFLYSDALNTIILVAGVYATQVLGFANAFEVLAPTVVAGLFGAFIFGYLADRIGSKQTLIICLIIGLIALLLAIAVAANSPSARFVFQWIVAMLAGSVIGSIQIVARTMLIELSPPEKLGEFMGFFNLTGKFAAVAGPVIWGGVLLLFDPHIFHALGYQIAIGFLALMTLAGLIIHWRGVPNIPRGRTTPAA